MYMKILIYNYSGKKKKHTIKTQILVDKSTNRILKTNFTNGRTHDFKLYKQSKIYLNESVEILADTGYQGICKLHQNSTTPIKKKRKTNLTEAEKDYNHTLSSKRIAVENVFCLLKRFRIISDKYRNRRRRFSLRFNLIAGLHNWELGF